MRTTGSGGGVHAEVRIGDTKVMIGGGNAWGGTPTATALHLYVPDADLVYRRAIEAGAVSLRPPVDQPYGDREASVQDLAGNHWYIATHQTGGHVPAGLGTVTPYLHPRGTERLIDFLKQAFAAEEMQIERMPDRTIKHAKIRVGASVIEMSEAHGEWGPMPTMFYVYLAVRPAVEVIEFVRASRSGCLPAWSCRLRSWPWRLSSRDPPPAVS